MLNINDVAFFGRAFESFQELLQEQANKVFAQYGIIVPVRSCSLMLLIASETGPSAADLARQLDYSHQLVLQKIPKLKKLGLIEIDADPADRRRKVYRATEAGAHQVALLEKSTPRHGQSVQRFVCRNRGFTPTHVGADGGTKSHASGATP